MKCKRLANWVGVISCMLLVLSLASCSKEGDLVTPENESTIKDLIIRNAQWNEEPDYPIQDYGNICGHVDNSAVVYSEHSAPGRQGFIFKGWDDLCPWALWPEGMAIIAWDEKESQNDNWDIYFRVFYISNQTGEFELGPAVLVENPGNADQTYPAVTAQLCLLPEFTYPPSYAVTVDIAYERQELGQPKEVWHSRYQGAMPGEDFFLLQSGQIPIPNFAPNQGDLIAQRHPDIVFYSTPPYGANNQAPCDTVFAVYELETLGYYGIAQCEFHAEFDEVGGFWYPGEWGNCGMLYDVEKPDFAAEIYLHRWPQYPRIDGGIDFAFGDGTSMVATVWQDLKWQGADDPFDPGVWYLDFDWLYTGVALSNYPNYAPFQIFVLPLPNDDYIWHIFPYIDFDPVEKFFHPLNGGHPTYAHTVVTTKEMYNNGEIYAWYGNSNMFMSNIEMKKVWSGESGIAAIAMHADQVFGSQSLPNFDILFLLKPPEPIFPWPVCSRKFYFMAENCLDPNPSDLDPVQVSDEGHHSFWSDPLDQNLILRSPVIAIFNSNDQDGVWVAGPPSLPLGYGDYNFGF